MNLNEFIILNSFYNGSRGRTSCSFDIDRLNAFKDVESLNTLKKNGFISSDEKITYAGLDALKPYEVNNAVILAAGASTRFIPLSLEQPKGLFEVKGEKLIERQITQLHDTGIYDISIVLGYKKEMFYYLKEKYGVKFIINESFNLKNNIESLFLARKELKNTYICVSDSYFIENPFNKYEYQSFYSGMTSDDKTNEMYVDIGHNSQIIKMEKGRNKGSYLYGQSFWNNEFSNAMIKLISNCHDSTEYKDKFWEWLVKDNLNNLPPFYFKEYKPGNIFEFDYFDELRQFDTKYLRNTHSEIIRNIKLVFRCDEEDIIDFRNVSKGMTNTSFIFKINNVDYIYRHPGDGTESIISRRNEKTSLIKAKEINIDPSYIYEDVNEGWKISLFIKEFREPDYSSFEDSKKILSVLRNLHNSNIKVSYGMKPWEDSVETEKLLKNKSPQCFEKYESLKEKVETIYKLTINDGVNKCFCHGDTYQPNWMIKPDGSVILIDWEYSGYSDPGIDVGYYIVDAMYDFDQADKFIKEYLKDTYSQTRYFHFYAYIAIIAYYWFVWALYRESCGANIGNSLEKWRFMAEKYADYILNGGINK